MSSKLERANQWLTFATNIGVIASFALVAFQIQQNTKAITVQT